MMKHKDIMQTLVIFVVFVAESIDIVLLST